MVRVLIFLFYCDFTMGDMLFPVNKFLKFQVNDDVNFVIPEFCRGRQEIKGKWCNWWRDRMAICLFFSSFISIFKWCVVCPKNQVKLEEHEIQPYLIQLYQSSVSFKITNNPLFTFIVFYVPKFVGNRVEYEGNVAALRVLGVFFCILTIFY